ncbi:2-dehydro-3-deoxy-D-arabinonate dehydratase [Anseongella ginsenosidimutans]|uniref:2-dehydro-3-deoxy-D-arabinonate dehydratase n=1 Tax=Anseongella ginsenosidimutans TaxID=496056 RepID=A0A4R3KPS7_9SPHI|nr:fumarylacetoacetate hydrolase family protein [Anseongella ginsenosidimutans]QEC52210.1 2-hydroxyhepta-2,4-diene-1,7-dioate isomerase [Anseongella ginsenosidimutans]TCS86758.1 2-dehydro-3-deoxy-D-arabinonate dehydratase [Anseongella ginsenosidimutans]
MRVFKTGSATVFIEHEGEFYQKDIPAWDTFINRKGLYSLLKEELKDFAKVAGELPEEAEFAAPVGSQEIWAAGVTYMRSMEARMEESKTAGGGSFYDRVYNAERPELFFKATAARTAGPGGTVNIRKDSAWDVPEPELTLFISSAGTIEGYTVGNDMSSRSIEGENPLYLPQAKVYDACAGLGPCIYVTEKPLPPETEISLEIRRGGQPVFTGRTSLSRIKRSFPELKDFLFRECSFPNGCFLMTGTGIIPPDDFTLALHDEIRISIPPIGVLVNYVGKNL